MPTLLPSSDSAHEVQRSKAHRLQVLTRRSLANLATSSQVKVFSDDSRASRSEAHRPHPSPQQASSHIHPCTVADADQVPADATDGPHRHPEEVWLWKFVGRACDPSRSTLCVNTWTRVIYTFCSVYKRDPVMGVPLVATPTHYHTIRSSHPHLLGST